MAGKNFFWKTAMNYGYQKDFSVGFDAFDLLVRDALSKNGFGVITEIDIHEKLREKLNVDFKRYRILGACNPSLAHQALLEDDFIGLLLPCNVIFWENPDNSVTAAAINASEMVSITKNDNLRSLSEEVDELLKLSIDSIEVQDRNA